jgi:predicted DNA binding protein
MSVVVEFTVESEQFTLGRVLSGSGSMQIELERVVPTGDTVMPFLWASGPDFERFERDVSGHESVDELVALDRVQGSTLYRVTWHEKANDLIQGIIDTGGTILRAHSDAHWTFHVRFPDHDTLSQFYNLCTDHGISIHIERTYTVTERTEGAQQFGLSDQQREALVLGLRTGYFDTPSQADLDDLASDLGISQQALSNRIRRGTKQVLEEALLSSSSDVE